MIHLRRGTVVSVEDRGNGVVALGVKVAGGLRNALAYPSLCGPIAEGDLVVLNASAVELGLGTGGYDFVIAVEGAADSDPPGAGHGMKLRYTPLQTIVQSVEETHRDALDAFPGLAGLPVVACGLHSALPAVALGVRAVAPRARIAYVMTDAGALPIAFSETVQAMRERGLLDATITCGQAFGGDLEAVNVYSGIVAARAVAGAEVIVAGMGPGNLGTGSRLGFALIEQGTIVNAIASLGGSPVVVPRLSFTDPRERHHGISHHSVTALTVAALARATVVLPDLDAAKTAIVAGQLERIREKHDVVTVDVADAEEALRASPVPLRTMGRSYDDDPEPFRAAAGAGVYTARAISG